MDFIRPPHAQGLRAQRASERDPEGKTTGQSQIIRNDPPNADNPTEATGAIQQVAPVNACGGLNQPACKIDLGSGTTGSPAPFSSDKLNYSVNTGAVTTSICPRPLFNYTADVPLFGSLSFNDEGHFCDLITPFETLLRLLSSFGAAFFFFRKVASA